MENKKILKFLLNDLSELEELVAGKSNGCFDNLEHEFMKSRLKGARKLVQLLYESEDTVEMLEKKQNNLPETNSIDTLPIVKKEVEIIPEIKNEILIENNLIADAKPFETTPEIQVEKENVIGEVPREEKEVEPFQSETKFEAKQRLGDTFSKEKSINDLLAAENNNLGYKLSNLPIASIQSAIGVNDRFQYIRELFNGSAEDFLKTVADLDAMNNIKEAVSYLQQNFKWQQNQTSIKFVNLVKRRFPNE